MNENSAVSRITQQMHAYELSNSMLRDCLGKEVLELLKAGRVVRVSMVMDEIMIEDITG